MREPSEDHTNFIVRLQCYKLNMMLVRFQRNKHVLHSAKSLTESWESPAQAFYQLLQFPAVHKLVINLNLELIQGPNPCFFCNTETCQNVSDKSELVPVYGFTRINFYFAKDHITSKGVWLGANDV
jgi:hypothetical protein